MKSVVDAKNGTNSLPAGLAKPAIRALNAAGCTDLKSLSNASESELLKLHGMGPKAIKIIRENLQEHDWDLRD